MVIFLVKMAGKNEPWLGSLNFLWKLRWEGNSDPFGIRSQPGLIFPRWFLRLRRIFHFFLEKVLFLGFGFEKGTFGQNLPKPAKVDFDWILAKSSALGKIFDFYLAGQAQKCF